MEPIRTVQRRAVVAADHWSLRPAATTTMSGWYPTTRRRVSRQAGLSTLVHEARPGDSQIGRLPSERLSHDRGYPRRPIPAPFHPVVGVAKEDRSNAGGAGHHLGRWIRDRDSGAAQGAGDVRCVRCRRWSARGGPGWLAAAVVLQDGRDGGPLRAWGDPGVRRRRARSQGQGTDDHCDERGDAYPCRARSVIRTLHRRALPASPCSARQCSARERVAEDRPTQACDIRQAFASPTR
jgi:hypothetical protein